MAQEYKKRELSIVDAESRKIRSESVAQKKPEAWSSFGKFAFRIGFIYVILLTVPSGVLSIPPDFGWFRQWVEYDWMNLHYRDLYSIARYQPSFPNISRWLGIPSLDGHGIWITLLVIAAAGAVIWTVFDRKRKEYNTLYYWSLVIARFRAGIGIIGFGFTKVLPVQMPYPSEGLLNTDFGDFTTQKIYWLSIGIVPWYQVFTGLVELTAGTMLFFRQTTVYGAALLFGALGSITIVNHVYDGGVQTYAFYFVLLGLYIFGYYVPRIYRFFVLQQYTVPVDYWPKFTVRWQQVVRFGLKAFVIVLFIGVFFVLQLNNFLYDPYKQPSSPGVKQLRGYYDVTTFRINGAEIPYSPLDTVRWQHVTFEKWSTMTFKVSRPTPLDLSNGGGSPIRDIDRTFEIAGTGGGQRVFHYYADTVGRTLYLQDKIRKGGNFENGEGGGGAIRAGRRRSPSVEGRRDTLAADPFGPDWISPDAWARIGDEAYFIDPRGLTARRLKEFARPARPVNRNKMILTYETTDGDRVVLTGLNENKDSIYVVLDRRERDYLLSRSTLDAGKYD